MELQYLGAVQIGLLFLVQVYVCNQHRVLYILVLLSLCGTRSGEAAALEKNIWDGFTALT